MEKQPGFLRLHQPRHASVPGQAVTAVISHPMLQAGAVPAPRLSFPLHTAQCNCKGQLLTHLCWRTWVQRQIHAVPYIPHVPMYIPPLALLCRCRDQPSCLKTDMGQELQVQDSNSCPTSTALGYNPMHRHAHSVHRCTPAAGSQRLAGPSGSVHFDTESRREHTGQ